MLTMDFDERSLLCAEELFSVHDHFHDSDENSLHRDNNSNAYNNNNNNRNTNFIAEAFPSPSPSPSSSSSSDRENIHYLRDALQRDVSSTNFDGDFMPFSFPQDGDDELSIAFLQTKHSEYTPQKEYLSEIMNQSRPNSINLAEYRCNAARWMIKAHFILKFSPLTVALAVNYMDRYLAKNMSMTWKSWMMELLSVACLSVAAKMEEIDVPALLDLQIDGMEHLFQAKTVQRMELNVLSALGWRLRSITPFTFLEKAINHLNLNSKLKSSLLFRSSELLLASLAEVEFLGLEPFVVAVTAICCASDEILPFRTHQLKDLMLKYIPLDEEKLRSCYLLMESLIVDPLSSPSLTLSGNHKLPLSPNTVILHYLEENNISNNSIDNTNNTSSRCGHSKFCVERIDLQEHDPNPKRQRRH